jgi:uncharacterized protein
MSAECSHGRQPGTDSPMTHRTSGWLSSTALLGALATMGSACTGTPLDFASGRAGAGGDSAAGGTGGSDAAGVGSAGEGDATGGTGGSDATGGTGGSDAAGAENTGGSDATGGTGGSDTAGVGGTGGSDATGGTGGSDAGGAGTTSGTGGALGGIGGALVGAAGAMAGDAGASATGPYAPRSGSFKALVYSEIRVGFSHSSSIASGQQMFRDLAAEFDFEVTESADFTFTAESLAPYEVVVFLNTAGDPLDQDEEEVFEHWITTKYGAFVGTHSATDTESGWPFYSELTGKYHDGHSFTTERPIVWEPDALDFPAVKGLPSPWLRSEEWFLFNDFPRWSTKPGFKILGTVQIEGVTHPVSFAREFMNFRSFYTALGHAESTFQDAMVRQHIVRGLLWAVRREHLLD